MAGSAWDGRIIQYVYLPPKEHTIPSQKAEYARNRMRAASASLFRYFTMSSRANAFQAALEVGLWFTFQNTAMATCSAVRVSEMWRTSARSALNLADPK